MKPFVAFLAFAIASLVFRLTAGTFDDPGLVSVVGEPSVALDLSLPASSAYKFTYDPARISIWDTITKDNLISPGQVLTAPPVPGDADGDGRADILLNGSLHWKNVGGSAQPALTPPPTSK